MVDYVSAGSLQGLGPALHYNHLYLRAAASTISQMFKWLDWDRQPPAGTPVHPTIKKHLYRAKREEIKYFTT